MRQLVQQLSIIGLLAVAASAGSAVTFSLSSPQGSTVVAPGSTVIWAIDFSVSSGDNQGAAMICVDLVQSPGNPSQIDLPPAVGAPAGMSNFNRPAGICNPGEGGAPSGYGGARRGPAGGRNLIQIGGAQNTFGQAFPSGSGVGENANVLTGIGQSGSQSLASGSFAAPTACGVYTFSLANPLANTLVVRNNPPAASPVAHATTSLASGSFSITVAPIGDVDLDFDVDIEDLAQLLANFGTAGGATLSQGDLTGDGDVELDDLSLMLSTFGTTCS